MQRKLARLEEQADSWLSSYAAAETGKAKDGGEDEPPPLRLHYPLNYALHTWADYHRHGLMPRPGGFDAQDVAWVADMQAITTRFNWHVRQLMDDSAERDLDVGEYVGAIAGVERRDWRDVLGE